MCNRHLGGSQYNAYHPNTTGPQVYRRDFHHHMRRFRCGPSRFVWFAVGAVIVTWWMKSNSSRMEGWKDRRMERRKEADDGRENASQRVTHVRSVSFFG